MIKPLILSATALLAASSTCAGGEVTRARPDVQYTRSGEALPPLPRRFQNHCGWDFGHLYCEDHCGAGYQIYYCTRASFGCCHVGDGYCDRDGLLRCRP